MVDAYRDYKEQKKRERERRDGRKEADGGSAGSALPESQRKDFFPTPDWVPEPLAIQLVLRYADEPAPYRHRRRHVHCVGMGVPVLKMTASERRSF